jgi:peptide/nickel transport system permease protein
LYVRYVFYLKNRVTLEWGNSFSSSKKVFDILQVRFRNTIILMGTGLCLTLPIGTGLGMIMAWRVNKPSGTAGALSAIVIQSMPPFVIALLLLMILSYRLDLFPTGGMYTPGITPGKGWISFISLDFLCRLLLPTITLIIYYLATLLLIIRNIMLEVIDSDFELMARAKGLARHLVIFKHAGRNAIMAAAALSSPMIGFAVSSQLTVEQAFNWPGLGKLLVQSAASDDYPVLQATFLVLTVLVVFLNFVLDISYRYFGPSINIHRRL